MATEKWAALTDRSSVLTTELNALANGSFSAVGSSVIDNTANLDTTAIAELTVDFVSAPTDYAGIDLYVIRSRDGTNYEDGAHPSPASLVGTFTVDDVTAAQRLMTRLFELPPCKCKFVLYNGSGQAFPATGSIVSISTTNRTIN